jgi:hypothetical protein
LNRSFHEIKLEFVRSFANRAIDFRCGVRPGKCTVFAISATLDHKVLESFNTFSRHQYTFFCGKIRNEVSNGPVDFKFEFVEGLVDVTDIASSHVVENINETVVDIVLVTAVSLELERSVGVEEEEATCFARGIYSSALQGVP